MWPALDVGQVSGGLRAMPKVVLDEAPGPHKACRICARPIPVEAKKCADCLSYQDWRSSLGVSTTVLSMLVALVSVVAAATPGFVSLLAGQDSKLAFGAPAMRRGAFLQFASNAGARPGVVDSAQITWFEGRSKSPGWIYLLDVQSADQAPMVLKPGDSALVRFALDMSGEGAVNLPKPSGKSVCEMHTLWTSFRGDQSRTRKRLSCEDVYVAVHVADLRKQVEAAKRAAR